MDKLYVVQDVYSNITRTLDYKELKQLIINELRCDILDNIEEHNIKEIVEYNYDTVSSLALGEILDIKEINDILCSFGWKVEEMEVL